MKKLFILMTIVLLFAGCKKDDEITATMVELKDEFVEKGWDYLKISAEYSYPEALKAVNIYLSENSDMSGAELYECNLDGKKISLEVKDLKDGLKYYYHYEYDNGYEKKKGEKRELMVVLTNEITGITTYSATGGGNVTSGGTVTSRGLCWGTSPNPTIADSHTTDGNGSGSFTLQMIGLTDNTTYYVRAYATYEKGTAYGEEKSFVTLATSGTINGYDWVDLGLPSGLKWATCNIGAENPEDYGDYYAWGETETKSTYTEENSITYGVEIEDISGNPEYDAATANWGSTWRMPTKEDCAELVNECTWQWTTQNGVNGQKVTGPNDNYIFLPAAGYRDGSSLFSDGNYGNYWSSTPADNNIYDIKAYYLNFGDGFVDVDGIYRYYGQTVRPVSE